MKKLTIKECQAYLLNIAKEFDEICSRHNIPYYMLGGTLLGAIRHRGFIPWDDDMDFGVPMPYYERLLKILEEELPYPYKVCTFYNHSGCGTAFAKIEDSTTRIADPRRNHIKLEEQMGLNIDLFPLVYCEDDDPKIAKIKRLKQVYGLVFTGNAQGVKWKNFLKSIMQRIVWHRRTWYLKKQYELVKEFSNNGSYLANLFGRWGKREMIPYEIYGKNTKYKFEDIELSGPEHFDEYLSHVYGDYMTPPPEQQRFTHVNNIYAK